MHDSALKRDRFLRNGASDTHWPDGFETQIASPVDKLSGFEKSEPALSHSSSL
jgi:hypothetical protein